MPLTLDRIMELVRKHDVIGGQIAKLDEQRVALDAERRAVKDELEGRKPGRRAAVKATVKPATSSAPPSTPTKSGEVDAELAELRPWFGAIKSETRRKVVELRAAGRSNDEIVRELRIENKAVQNAAYQGRLQLRAARQAGAKAKPGKTTASDPEDGPGAQLDELDAYNLSLAAPVAVDSSRLPAPARDIPADVDDEPDGEDEEPEPPEAETIGAIDETIEADDELTAGEKRCPKCGELGHDGRKHRWDGTRVEKKPRPPAPPPLPTEWEPPVDPTGRKPGEIDPDVDLSEFFPDEPEPVTKETAAPAVEKEELAELQALREYFPALSPNQQYVVEATLEGIPQEKMAERQGASRHSIRTTLTMAYARLRSLQQKAAANGTTASDGLPSIARIRRRRLAVLNADERVRCATIPPGHLSREERAAGELLEYPANVDRPKMRSDCMDMDRPCPFVSCSHHLYLDVNPLTGAIKINFPHLEVWEMPETCSLDVADRGGITLEEVGAILNLTRERIRQVEVRGLDNIKRARERGKFELEDLPADDNESPMARLQAMG